MTVEDVLNELAKENDAVSWKCFVADKNKYGYPEYEWDELIERAVELAFLAGKNEKQEILEHKLDDANNAFNNCDNVLKYWRNKYKKLKRLSEAKK